MTKIEALELELAARKMVEGTGLDWWRVVRYNNHGVKIAFFNAPLLDCHVAHLIEFALGIIEGKPVWDGDEAYWTELRGTTHKLTVADGCNLTVPGWSWCKPNPKTVMVELPVKHVEYWDSQGEFLRSALEHKPLDVKSMTFYAACHKALENLK